MQSNYSLLILLLLSSLSASAGQNPIDQIVSVIYAPMLTVLPDENADSYPNSLTVKLLINDRGLVNDVQYPRLTPEFIKIKVNDAMRSARFTPYIKQAKAVQSLVPYTINFYLLSKEESRGY